MSANALIFDVANMPDGSLTLLPEARTTSGSGEPNKFKPSAAEFPADGSTEWARWGDMDDSPTSWRESLEHVPIAMAAIRKMVSIAYGNGIAYVLDSDLHAVARGEAKTVRRAYIPEIEQFKKENRIHRWLIGQLTDWHIYMNAFSEIGWDLGKRNIKRIWHKEAEYCRITLPDSANLYSTHMVFSPFFADRQQPTSKDRAKIPLYNIKVAEEMQRHLMSPAAKTFAYHSHYPTPGLRYYSRPLWIGLFRKGGWLEVAKNVPEIVASMQRNQVSIKYQIYIPEDYFKVRHAGWDTMTAENRKKIIDTKINELKNWVQNSKGGTLSQVYKHADAFSGGKGDGLDKIQVIAVDDKMKTGTWVPDSNAADSQIVQSLGLHPSQMGLSPQGGKMGAGSGSDQRESYNTQITINTLDQHIVLEPLNLIAEKNNWPVTFLIDHTRHTTINEQESGMVTDPSTGLEIS